MRQVVLSPGEDGYWVVECPSLPGCISQGKTREEAIRNIREAINGYIATLREDGLPVPEKRLSGGQSWISPIREYLPNPRHPRSIDLKTDSGE